MRIFITGLIIIMVIFLGFKAVLIIKGEYTARAVSARCKTLRMGMATEEVYLVMGEPYATSTSRDPDAIYYFYQSSRVASEQTSVKFKSGRVIEMVCGDDYRTGE